jgi:hypothetical protein
MWIDWCLQVVGQPRSRKTEYSSSLETKQESKEREKPKTDIDEDEAELKN